MVAVSIVVHNTLKQQLRSVLKCVFNCHIKTVCVIDNGERRDLEEIWKEYLNVEYIHVENRGYGAAHNIAFKKSIDAGFRYHLAINPDVAWDGDIVTPIVEFMEEHPNVGLLSPQIFYPDGILQYSCRRLPTPIDVFSKRFLPSFMIRNLMSRYLLENVDHSMIINCPYLLGSFLFFRIDALRDAGLFDERFFMYPEDIDISRRIHRNWETLYWPEVCVIHNHNAESRRNLKMLLIHIKNMIKYFNKWGWLFDEERNIFNETMTKSLHYLPSGSISGRG